MDVRRLRSGDGDRLREVRLRALEEAPYAFSSSLEREAVLGVEFWAGRVAESELGVDGVAFVAVEGEHSLGMAGGFFPAARATSRCCGACGWTRGRAAEV